MSSYSTTIKKAKQVAAQSAAAKKKRKNPSGANAPSATAPPASLSVVTKKPSRLRVDGDYSDASDSELELSSASVNSEEEESEFSEEEEDAEDYCKGGYHPVQIGDKFNEGRYTILRKLGWGHFSTVWLAQDHKFDRPCALKIVKSAPHYTETALDEIKLLDKVVSANRNSPERKCVVELLDWFKHRGPHGTHICMAFEVLGPNLLTLIRQYHHHGIPVAIVKRIIKQVLMGLDYLHRECGIIHTDLKPENVLICINVSETLRKLGLTPSQAANAAGKSSAVPMDIDRSTPQPGSPASTGTSTPITEESLANMTYAQRKKAKYKLKKMGKWNGGTGAKEVNGAGGEDVQAGHEEGQDVEMRDVKEDSVPPVDAPQQQPQQSQQQHSQGQTDKPFDPKFLERKTGARDNDPTGSLPDISAGASANVSANVSRAGSSEKLEVEKGVTDALGRLSEVTLKDALKGLPSVIVPHGGISTDPVEAARGKARLEEERPKEKKDGKEKEKDEAERKKRRKEERKERRMKEDERIQVCLTLFTFLN
ncbi:serine/threonine protein kinase, CMGC group [Rhizophlyctis rosea]|uniref:non-specific serine/threonine protein kinase n=1 Tax=Rhizophlyctis rosea TaxID=64517 RepID=A0AAD5S2R4_9FUNG|nr:serine/threonine protein kinase, CMGC group [Rhizophlyctis rosea]